MILLLIYHLNFFCQEFLNVFKKFFQLNVMKKIEDVNLTLNTYSSKKYFDSS